MVCEEVRRVVSDGDRRVLRARRVRAHLRDCAGCTAFAAAIPARRSDLQALVPPLAPLAATGLLARMTATGSVHGSGGAAAGGAATVTAGKMASAGVATKALVGVAILAGSAAGLTGALVAGGHQHRRSSHARQPAQAHSPVAAARPGGRTPGTPSSRGHGPRAHRGAIHRSPAQSVTSATRPFAGEAQAVPNGRAHGISHGSGRTQGGARTRRHGAGSGQNGQVHTKRAPPATAVSAPRNSRSNASPANLPTPAGERHTATPGVSG
jgi:hypothetical protein